MPERKSLPAALLVVAGLSASSLAGARADDKCLGPPNASPPPGQHWYYRFDRVEKRPCWYLREQGLPVRKHAPQAERPVAPPADAQPQAVTAAPAAPPPDDDFPAQAAPVLWLDVTNLSMLTPAAQPAPPAPIEAAAGGDRAYALFMLLFAALAIGGPALHYAQRRRRRARETASFRPPRWARVVALNAPTPRIRVPLPRARNDAPAPHPAAIPLACSEHTERLAQALQELADRLRAQPEPAPSIVPHPARRPPPRYQEAPERGGGRPMPAEAFGAPGKAAARERDGVRRLS